MCEFTTKTYYMAINPLTLNWCISKTEGYASTMKSEYDSITDKYITTLNHTDNIIFDSGWTNIGKAEDTIKNYCKEEMKKGIIIKLIKN